VSRTNEVSIFFDDYGFKTTRLIYSGVKLTVRQIVITSVTSDESVSIHLNRREEVGVQNPASLLLFLEKCVV